MPRTRFSRLLKILRKRFSEEELVLVRRAYAYADQAHRGQVRRSGEPYILHTLHVGIILASSGLDPVTVSAGLLHDVIEDTDITHDEMVKEFGEEIVRLVDGVTKIRKIGLPEQETMELKQAQNIRKLLVATAEDVRVILIKLADRLHNMRTLEFLSEERRRRIARETLDIYTPIADRLGISSWKWELEDLAFRQLRPDSYAEIKELVAMTRREREQQLNALCALIDVRLKKEGIEAEVIGRPKHLYSIYRKMMNQGKTFQEVMDVEAIRVITQDTRACYNALGVVHDLWPPVPGRFKDYISIPKYNMYQSIHTTLMRDTGRPLEIQIRTQSMDHTAHEGIAAHWAYKEGGHDKKLDDQLAWLRTLFEWLQDAASTEDILASVTRGFAPAHVYVFTPKGEVKELPRGATPLDFAYEIHSGVGNHCVRAKVHNRIVPLTYHLQTGDVVEIITSKNQHPSRAWLDVVVTGKARARIRQRLREIGALEPVEPKPEHHHQPAPPKPKKKLVEPYDVATRQKLIRIDGASGLTVGFAKCCDPMPGQPVIAYVTLNPAGVSVHREDCKAFRKSPRDASRTLPAFWEGEGHIEQAIRVIIGQRPNVLADLMDALRPMNLPILEARFEPMPGNGKSRFDFLCELPDDAALERLKRTVRNVPGVASINRLNRSHFAHPTGEPNAE
jgi:GTP pyrophosphokinase